jgi:hypothetical protein
MDVVEEQIASGDAEPVPTPAVEGIEEKMETVEIPGGLEQIDVAIAEAKAEEEEHEGVSDAVGPRDQTQGVETTAAQTQAILEAPKVEEVSDPAGDEKDTVEAPVSEKGVAAEGFEAATSAAPVDARKQERVDNPIYTLQIVGNRYNPSNFWYVHALPILLLADYLPGLADGERDGQWTKEGVKSAASSTSTFTITNKAMYNSLQTIRLRSLIQFQRVGANQSRPR